MQTGGFFNDYFSIKNGIIEEMSREGFFVKPDSQLDFSWTFANCY